MRVCDVCGKVADEQLGKIDEVVVEVGVVTQERHRTFLVDMHRRCMEKLGDRIAELLKQKPITRAALGGVSEAVLMQPWHRSHAAPAPNAGTCFNCGEKFESCGMTIDDDTDNRFCGGCGSKVTADPGFRFDDMSSCDKVSMKASDVLGKDDGAAPLVSFHLRGDLKAGRVLGSLGSGMLAVRVAGGTVQAVPESCVLECDRGKLAGLQSFHFQPETADGS